MTDHTETHEQAEKALDKMEERSERLERQVEDTKRDWESKKADDSVPGAGGRQEDAHSDAHESEADYPTKSSSDDVQT